jgi:hypothetical protein
MAAFSLVKAALGMILGGYELGAHHKVDAHLCILGI